jgi:septal ring factor EnvC (AmiA/AmiB activator)
MLDARCEANIRLAYNPSIEHRVSSIEEIAMIDKETKKRFKKIQQEIKRIKKELSKIELRPCQNDAELKQKEADLKELSIKLREFEKEQDRFILDSGRVKHSL